MDTRREFIKKTALGAAGLTLAGMGMTANSYARILGSNERINVAIVGLGRRLGAFTEPISMSSANLHLVYLCDVMERLRTRAARRFSDLIDYQPRLENDYRKILDDANVDAIINAMPDHWHAPGAIMGVQAGKHVYVEKPGSHNALEGELLSKAYTKYGKVIQLGNQQRSSSESIEIVKRIHDGVIGNPYKATSFYVNNRGKTPIATPAPVPEGLDWDLWQGPAPRSEYKHDTWDYHWHWYGWTYGTGEMGNNAIHELDIARWALQAKHPERVTVEADKRHFLDDGWTIYDTMKATYFYPGNKVIEWDGKSRNGHDTYGSGRGNIIFGSEGSVFVNRNGYRLYDRDGKLVENRMQDSRDDGTALGGGGSMDTRHVINFFNTIRGQEELKSPIDEMMISTHMCHLANLSYRLRKDLTIDPNTGKTTDPDAQKLWGREYEPGWELNV